MRVVVLGAGILGASAAWHLARAGADVVVVDDARTGRATSAGAGIIVAWAGGSSDPVFDALRLAAARFYPEIVAALAEAGETDLGFARPGALSVSADPDELDRIAEFAATIAAEMPEAGAVRRLGPREARALFPPLHPELGAVQIDGGMRVDGRLIAAAMLRAAIACGARFQEGTGELVVSGSRISGVRVGGGLIAADAAVVTAGAWAPALLAPLGLRLNLVPVRGQILHLEVANAGTETWPVVLPASSDHYLLAFPQGRVVVGATREWDAGFDARLTAGGVAEVLAEALAVAPGLADATLRETRVGLRPASRDGRPFLGAAHGWDGLFIGNGLGASGLTIGPLAGRMLADLVLGRPPGFDLAPLDPTR